MTHIFAKHCLLKIVLFILILPIEQVYSQSQESPCPRNQPVLTYHSKTNNIFLFGGFCSTTKKRLNDLWKFDGKKWELVKSKMAPTPRSGHAMVYDSFRDRLIVFGGKNQQRELLNDLWSWDGTNWTLLSNEGPTPRQSHRIAFNSDNGDIFLFGGSNISKQSLNDTWIFRNGKWKRLTPKQSPAPRFQHTLSYDQQRKKMVLFGGGHRDDNGKTIYGDTWEWSISQGWMLKDENTKMARDHHAMAYDPDSKKIMLFGGYNKGYLGDTWSWNGKKWILKTTEGPARAGKPGLIFNTLEKSMMLFGGGNNENMYLMDFWQFNSTANSWNPHIKK
ncbi:kelch repeat-containing protein [Flavobacteriaceae bacterium S356]|uniref:Kelch repeat-containing protein n=1 Tax=Asprobacillus argus TaxID=3076534 RepID=A0ABU3LBI1_9FLAO|nr:kelch repeat-containing protein [Flavobacteriaceae bacterium S356]